MGRISKVVKHNLAPLIEALQADGITEHTALAAAINERVPAAQMSRDAVRRWLSKSAPSPQAKPAPVKTKAAPVDDDPDWLTRVIRNYIGLAESTDVPLDARMRALEQAGYFAIFRETGSPP